MKKYTLIVTISLGLFILVLQLPFRAKHYGDLTFHEEAKALAAWATNDKPFNEVTITKAPGPVLFYFIPYLLGGKNSTDAELWKLGVAWNVLWLIIALLLIYRTTEMLLGKRAAWISIILTFILPLHLYYGVGILAETMAFAGCSLFCYGTVALFRGNAVTKVRKIYHILALTTGIVMMATARPNILMMMAIIPFFLMLLYKKGGVSLVKSIKNYSLGYIMAFLIIICVNIIVRNLPGNRFQSGQTAYFTAVAHIGRFQFRNEPWDWRFWDSSIRPDSRDYQDYINSVENLKLEIEESGRVFKEIYFEWIIRDISQHPTMIIKQFIVRTLFGNFLQVSSVDPEKFTLGPFKGEWVYYLLHIVLNTLNITILLTSFYGFFKKIKTDPFILLIIVPWLSLIIFSGLVYMEQRYLYPGRPFFIVFSSGVLASWLPNFGQKSHLEKDIISNR